MSEREQLEEILRNDLGYSQDQINLVDLYKVEGCTNGTELRDTDGQPIPNFNYEGTIFWIDLVPPANWDHSCLYIADTGTKVHYVEHNQPPHANLRELE
ncbi:TPA: hypothetical protein HA278_02970 [Candidatus Woesearchaeota archaeon]|nr:hypothetical protein [archaeon]HIJ10996.1 hypothetical protein [Candidatus Woesearchaeota archaeon]|tara:strand:+ start:156 stop:452 length:297 start_codon:yes stop_codon:yes gene_type:complete